MISPEQYEKNKKSAELTAELSRVVEHQIYGHMDWVRARAWWRTALPGLDTDLLAEALAYALNSATIHLKDPSGRRKWG